MFHLNKIFNMKNLYTLLFVVAMYALFVILFIDVLKEREFNIGFQSISVLIICIIVFTWVSRYFFNLTESKLPNVKILIILVVSIVLSLMLQSIVFLQPDFSFKEKEFRNPLYRAYMDIAKKNDLDLSFTEKVWIQRGPNNYKINTIFNKEPKSLDIIFFGDSSIAWGLIPNILEQMTGKKIAMYAYESNVLTAKTARIFNKISKYYLKDDGLVVFSFINGLQDKDPNSAIISKKELDEMLKWSEKDFENYVKKSEMTTYKKYFSYKAFKSFYDEVSEYLKVEKGLHLKAPSFYKAYVEPLINPKLAKNKAINKNQETKFLRWDMDSITEYNPKFTLKSIHSERMPSTVLVNKNIERNSQATSEIYGHKIYMVSLFNNHATYIKSRNIYYTYYKDLGFGLCDLGFLQPKNEAYIMQSGNHMGNTGGLMKSILIGKWLRELDKKSAQ